MAQKAQWPFEESPHAKAKSFVWRGAAFPFPSPRPSPRGEGEPFPRSANNPERALFHCGKLAPLPTGEGQGEGKRREFHPAYWINHGTVEQRDLRQSRRVPEMTLTLSLMKGI